MTNDSLAWNTSSELPLFPCIQIWYRVWTSGFGPLLLRWCLNANGRTWQLSADSCLAVSFTVKVKTSVPLSHADFWMQRSRDTYQQKFGLTRSSLPRPTFPAVLLPACLRGPGEVQCLGWDWSIPRPPQFPDFLQLTINKCSALLPCNGQVLPLFWSCIQVVFRAQALQNFSNIISIHLNQQEISWIIIESGWSYLWHPKFHSLMQFFISLKVHHNSLLHTVHCFLKSVICYR